MAYARRAALTLAVVATTGLGCLTSDTTGVPLYNGGATTRRPRSEIAEVMGPIARIDEHDVVDQGGDFELLPGCHIVELDRRIPSDNFALSGGTYWSGLFPITTFAIHMKAGARYVIRRSVVSDGNSRASMALSAREEDPGGSSRNVLPTTSDEVINACRGEHAARPEVP